MIPPEITPGGILGILGSILVTIGTVFALWRKKSNTQVAVTEDSSRIGWIGDLDTRMRFMQIQMDQLLIKERNTHDLHQECLRLNSLMIEQIKGLKTELAQMRRLLFSVRPELKEIFGGASVPGTLGD